MGWFWAESASRTGTTVAPHPTPKDGAIPPVSQSGDVTPSLMGKQSSCPMHDSASPLLNAVQHPASNASKASSESSCPVKSPSQSSRYPTNPSESIASPTQPQTESIATSTLSKLNPLNYMPNLTNARLEDSPQTVALPLEREPSSIPRGDTDSNWEYPSPQQMYNAMLRKGYTDTPVDAVESMVAIHNFLNEGAWEEIVQWENIFSQGLARGWDQCKQGEEGLARERARREFLKARRQALGTTINQEDTNSEPKLLRFQGRPKEPTPKSRILQVFSKMFPDSFSQDPPFDRHDWYVARTQPNGTVSERRYVIDYYGGGLQATGEPVFYLDIRPAADGPGQIAERVIRWGGDVWWRASGGSARLNTSKET